MSLFDSAFLFCYNDKWDNVGYMIEAVATTLANAAYARVETQKLAVQPASVRPLPVVKASVAAPYISPYVIVDETSSKAILAMRDSATGNIVRQYPAESQIRAYQRTEAIMAMITAGARGDVAETTPAVARPKTQRETEFAPAENANVDQAAVPLGMDMPPMPESYVPVDLDV